MFYSCSCGRCLPSACLGWNVVQIGALRAWFISIADLKHLLPWASIYYFKFTLPFQLFLLDCYSITTRFLLLNMFRIDRTWRFPDPQFTTREISVTEAPDSCLDHSHVATQLDTILLRIFSGSDRQYPDWFEWPNTSLDQRGYVPARHQIISHWTTRLSIPDLTKDRRHGSIHVYRSPAHIPRQAGDWCYYWTKPQTTE